MSRLIYKLGVVGLFLLFSNNLKVKAGEEESQSEDSQITKMARERLYPGGQDEEDLEVQSQLLKPVRKLDIEKEKMESSTINDDEF